MSKVVLPCFGLASWRPHTPQRNVASGLATPVKPVPGRLCKGHS